MKKKSLFSRTAFVIQTVGLTALLVLMTLFFSNTLFAQEELPVDTDQLEQPATASSQIVVQRERLAGEIEDQHSQLLTQLNQYQQDERQYRVSLDQFQRLQTLNSIEKIVEDSKQIIRSRNDVLSSYLNLLRLKLTEAQGIEISHKNAAIQQIEVLREQLGQFSGEIETYSQREEINAYSARFLPVSEEITTVSYYSLVILTIGRLQAVYDQEVVINQLMQGDLPEEQALSTSRARSLHEVDKLLIELAPQFSQLWSEVASASESESGYENLYRSMNRELTPIYASLSRLLAYYQELENVK
jgi:hypothetical protein